MSDTHFVIVSFDVHRFNDDDDDDEIAHFGVRWITSKLV